jgi:hypothetical protein
MAKCALATQHVLANERCVKCHNLIQNVFFEMFFSCAANLKLPRRQQITVSGVRRELRQKAGDFSPAVLA